MKCDWVFLAQDRSKREVTLDEQAVPQAGDGKVFDGKGFEVAVIVTNRTTSPNPVVIAVEWLPKP